MDPDIQTSILEVKHAIELKLMSTAKFSEKVKLVLPVVIAGFPYLLFEEALMRRSVDTLPRYNPTESSPGETASLHSAGSSEEGSVLSVGAMTGGTNLEDIVFYLSQISIQQALDEITREAGPEANLDEITTKKEIDREEEEDDDKTLCK